MPPKRPTIDYAERARKAAATRAAKKPRLEEAQDAAMINDSERRLTNELISTGVGDQVQSAPDASGPSSSTNRTGYVYANVGRLGMQVVGMRSMFNGTIMLSQGKYKVLNLLFTANAM